MDIDQLSYREVADVLSNLGAIVSDARKSYGLSLRQFAIEADMPFMNVYRIEKGADCTISNAIRILEWLDRQASPCP